MKLGALELNWRSRKKSYNELVTMLNREKSEAVALKTSPTIQLGEYKSWAYNCVSLIKDRVSTMPYSFYNKATGEKLTTKNKNYRNFTKPFEHPNDFMSFRFIKAWCQIQLDLCGTTCIYKGYNDLHQVWELWPLNMNEFIKVEVGGEFYNPTVKYFFRNGNSGRYFEFDINELIVIMYAHPKEPWMGMSPIQSQAYAQDIDTYIEVYERDF